LKGSGFMRFKNLTILLFASFFFLMEGTWRSSMGTQEEEEDFRPKQKKSLLNDFFPKTPSLNKKLTSQKSKEEVYEVSFPYIEMMKMVFYGKAFIPRFSTEEEQIEELADAIETERRKVILLFGFGDKGDSSPYIEQNNPYRTLVLKAFDLISQRRSQKNTVFSNREIPSSDEESAVISASAEEKKQSLPQKEVLGNAYAHTHSLLLSTENERRPFVARAFMLMESDFIEDPSLREETREKSKQQNLIDGGTEKPPLDPQKLREPDSVVFFPGNKGSFLSMMEEILGQKTTKKLTIESSLTLQTKKMSNVKTHYDRATPYSLKEEEHKRELFRAHPALYKEHPQINSLSDGDQSKEIFPQEDKGKHSAFNPLVSMIQINSYAVQIAEITALAFSGWLVQNISLMGFTAPTLNGTRRRRKNKFLL
jgi:hypothetical protein